MQCSGGPVAIQNYRFPIFVETMPSNFGVLGKHQNSSVIQKNRMLMAFFFPFHCFFFFLVPHFGLEYVFIYCKILSWPLHAHWAFQNKSHTLHPLNTHVLIVHAIYKWILDIQHEHIHRRAFWSIQHATRSVLEKLLRKHPFFRWLEPTALCLALTRIA